MAAVLHVTNVLTCAEAHVGHLRLVLQLQQSSSSMRGVGGALWEFSGSPIISAWRRIYLFILPEQLLS